MVEAPHGIAVEPVEGLDEARLIEDSPASQRVGRIAAQVARDLGYRLVRVKISAAAGATLQIMAERPNGTMSIEDCERLSQALSPAFDVEEPMTQAYRLEISSPGIDRPLVRESDFARAIGHEARIEMAAAVNGRIKAVAPGAEAPAVRMSLVGDDMSETEVELPIRAMAEARLVLTDDLIRAALTREKAALKDAKRLKGGATDVGRNDNDNPRVAPGMKSNQRKAAARGAAAKPLGPDRGDHNGR
jgi:ribosome maturation factor RimP